MNNQENTNSNSNTVNDPEQQIQVLSYKLVILGDIAVGKSSIAQR